MKHPKHFNTWSELLRPDSALLFAMRKTCNPGVVVIYTKSMVPCLFGQLLFVNIDPLPAVLFFGEFRKFSMEEF